MNIQETPCIIAVPSIFIVAPSGIVNEEIDLLTPNLSIFSKLRGIDALLDAVENVTKAISKNSFKTLVLKVLNML